MVGNDLCDLTIAELGEKIASKVRRLLRWSRRI